MWKIECIYGTEDVCPVRLQRFSVSEVTSQVWEIHSVFVQSQRDRAGLTLLVIVNWP